MTTHEIRGGCHCGDVTLRFTTGLAPARLEHRTCRCGFCSRQGARYVSDPDGSVSIDQRDAASLVRYRFATATAEFLSCSRCGVYLAAVSRIDGRDYAVVNANALELPPSPGPARDFDDETVEDRLARRARTWTPVASPIGADTSPPIRWNVHLASPPARVHEALVALVQRTEIVECVAPIRLTLRAPDGAELGFHVEADGHGGSDLRFVARGVRRDRWLGEYGCWLASLLALKATVDFDVDLLAHVPDRTRANRYVDGCS